MQASQWFLFSRNVFSTEPRILFAPPVSSHPTASLLEQVNAFSPIAVHRRMDAPNVASLTYPFQVLFLYDSILTTGDELHCFWGRKIKGAAALFWLNKYMTTLYLSWSITVSSTSWDWSDEVCTIQYGFVITLEQFYQPPPFSQRCVDLWDLCPIRALD